MYIISKDHKSIVNLALSTSVYVGADGCSLKADFENGKGCQIGRYNSDVEARAAIEIISANVGKTEICYMPSDETVRAKLDVTERRQHHISGKKTKGHGGS
jgi:hypothetical protein